jgi:phage tail sheath protein FI
MNKIALTALALLFATGGAFAGSDHFGSDNANQPVASIAGVDHAVTGAVKNTDMAGHKAADAKMKTATDWPEPGQGIWGN